MRYEMIGDKLPWKDKIDELLSYSGYIGAPAGRLTGFFAIFGSALAVVTFFEVFLFTDKALFALFGGAGAFAAFQAAPYLFLSVIADRRAVEVDKILPDALQLMAANIRAGMTTDRAIWLSARPEFGPLETEIKRVSSKVLGGEPMSKALNQMNKHVDSSLLDRAVKLMIEGIRSGGEMATLLEETASDIRTAQNMKRKVKSNVTMYSMFIIFASVFGAPLLFAISLYFIEVTTELWGAQMSQVSEGFSSSIGGGIISMEGPQVAPAELRLFAIAAIVVTTFFGGLIIGLIQEGKATRGLKYSPLMAGGALGLFFAAKYLVTKLFGGMIGF